MMTVDSFLNSNFKISEKTQKLGKISNRDTFLIHFFNLIFKYYLLTN